MRRLTNKQAAIISAYTGILTCPYPDFKKYAETKLGHPIYTTFLENDHFWEELKQATQQDFETIAYNPKPKKHACQETSEWGSTCTLRKNHDLWHVSPDNGKWGPAVNTHCLTCKTPNQPKIYKGRPVLSCPQCGVFIMQTADIPHAELKALFANSGLGIDPDGTLHTETSLTDD